MASPASISKHPIHPMLIVFPIGLWSFSLIADLIYVAGLGGAIWNEIAYFTMAGGIIGAIVAAIPGLIDFSSITNRKAKEIGLIHMVINLTLVALFSINLWLRTDNIPGAALPIILSVLGVLLLGVSGWLGGDMVYKLGISVDTSDYLHEQEQINYEYDHKDRRKAQTDRRRAA